MDRPIYGYIAANVIVLILVIWLFRKSVEFMGVGERTWAIIAFAAALGLIVFVIGQVVLYFGFKKQMESQQKELYEKLNKKD